METVLHRPSTEESKVAERAYRKLEPLQSDTTSGEKHRLEISIDDGGKISIPESALHFLVELLHFMGQGKSITLMPVDSEMSTQQAADVLNVSRPHLVKLLEGGKIPFHKVGRHRRVKVQDIMEYKQKKSETRSKMLRKLSEEAQKLDVEY